MTMNQAYLTATCLTFSMSLLACADRVKPAQPPQTDFTKSDLENAADELRKESSDDGRSGAIVVDDQIAKQCDLPTAHFAFDHSNVAVESSEALTALATCLSTGALKGRAVTLVGHADPRGEVEYNFALGQRRAGSVAAYLVAHGMQESNMTTSSRGELEATGDDAAGWARDRKVEIFFAN